MNRKLSLESLADGIPVVFGDTVPWYKRNCAVCFYTQGHSPGVILRVDYKGREERFELYWECEVTDQMVRAFLGDTKKATDFAACAIVFCLVRELTDYKTVEQASLGTTVDYYLADKNADDDLIFNHTARIEISGILKETEDNTVRDRINSKKRRLKPEPTGNMPTLIAVVEFSEPWSQMVNV